MLWWANTIKICLKFHEISRWLWNGSFPSKSDRFATWNMAATKTFASRSKTAFMFLGLRRLPADKNQGVILTGQPHWPIRAVLVLCACAVLSNSKLTWQDPTRHKCAWVQPDNADSIPWTYIYTHGACWISDAIAGIQYKWLLPTLQSGKVV